MEPFLTRLTKYWKISESYVIQLNLDLGYNGGSFLQDLDMKAQTLCQAHNFPDCIKEESKNTVFPVDECVYTGCLYALRLFIFTCFNLVISRVNNI